MSMKRHQIRRMIPGNVSDAHLRRAIASLQLPSEDDYSYSDEQAKAIIASFKPSAEISTHTNRDRHAQSQQTAHQQTAQDKAVLANRTRSQLAGINASLDKIKSDRTNAVEQVSDTLAYLYSPQTFQADVLKRTSEKLGLGQTDKPEVLTLDSLAECFSSFANGVEYPAIAPNTIAGALPM